MQIDTNKPLSELTTMRLGGPARFVAHITTVDELRTICQNAKRLGQKTYVLGGGSNIIAHDEGFEGVIILNEIKGFEVLGEDTDRLAIKAGAGEWLDDIVQKTVEMNLSGIEALSAIPGTIGAAPVQNVGAYGQEISDTFISLEAYDTTTDTIVELTRDDCNFGYRNSIFRSTAQNRYVILSVTLSLFKAAPRPPFYAAVQEYVDTFHIDPVTPQAIRQAVIAIRANKLPDPKVTANTGSFFKNSIVESWRVKDLKEKYPDMPAYEMDADHHKVPSGWLIETAGLKGAVIQGMKVHDKNALVLINQSASSYSDLAAAREEIISAVRDQFQITLEQEPLELI